MKIKKFKIILSLFLIIGIAAGGAGPSGFASAPTVRPHDASQRRLSSLTRSARASTFQPVEHLHQHRREHHTATVFAAGLLKRIRQAAALRSGQFTGGSFNSDEWCEAPRLINRLDAAPVVLYRGQPVAVPAVPGHLRFP